MEWEIEECNENFIAGKSIANANLKKNTAVLLDGTFSPETLKKRKERLKKRKREKERPNIILQLLNIFVCLFILTPFLILLFPISLYERFMRRRDEKGERD